VRHKNTLKFFSVARVRRGIFNNFCQERLPKSGRLKDKKTFMPKITEMPRGILELHQAMLWIFNETRCIFWLSVEFFVFCLVQLRVKALH